MQDKLGNPVQRGNRLVDGFGDHWIVVAPAMNGQAHLQNVKSARRVLTKPSEMLLAPKDWRDKEKYPNFRQWFLHKLNII